MASDWGFSLPARYSAKRRLGSGSFGVLIAATDTATNEEVAIKRVSCGGQPALCKLLLRELKLLQHFDHENIMHLRDILLPQTGEQDASFPPNDVYLVQDCMACDLHYIIQSAARGEQELSDDHIQYFLYQILRGLYTTHSANVLHRDLKPQNLLVNRDCELRICDFGLARGFDGNAEEDARLTEYVVTRWYRAPELLTCNSVYGAPIDMWSVGCILGKMIRRSGAHVPPPTI